MEEAETRARKSWKMVCHDIGSMRKEFDVKNSKVQEKADGRNVVKTFVERYLMKTRERRGLCGAKQSVQYLQEVESARTIKEDGFGEEEMF